MDSVIETFYGHIKTIQDAEICLEACIHGRLPLITHMPVVLTGLCIRSGSVIVFPENANNIQLNRWRDGGRWSASRICGNFLLYREIEPTIKGAQQRQSTLLPKTPYSRRGTLEKSSLFTTLSLRKDTTLVPNGLAKRTITLVGSDGLKYRVINYFYPQDVEHLYHNPHLDGVLRMPSEYRDLIVCAFSRHQQCHSGKGSTAEMSTSLPRPSSPTLMSSSDSRLVVMSESHGFVKQSTLCKCGGSCFNLSMHLQFLHSHPGIWTGEFIRLPPLRM